MKRNFPVLSTLLLLFISGGFSSCKKDVAVPTDELNQIFGTWEWSMSLGGYSGRAETPVSSGFTRQLELNKKGIGRFYKNGKQVSKNGFTLKSEPSASSQTGYIIKINFRKTGICEKHSSQTQLVGFIGSDTLVLTDYDCSDGSSCFYFRKK